MGTTAAPWAEQAEQAADDLRRRARLPGRVPPSLVAQTLGFKVKVKVLEEGLDGYHVEGTKRLVVAKCWHAPRVESGIAHELAEAHTKRTLPDAEHEEYCERFASALMLPSHAFLGTLFAAGLDLARLRRQEWPWASWERLARRTSDLLPGAVSAAWTDDAPKWRSPEGTATAAECGAIKDARKRGRGLVMAGGKVATAWSLAPKGATFRAVSLCFPMR